ncbi:MAG TPA: GtrA family protein [Burkholderiaceae bacterium]
MIAPLARWLRFARYALVGAVGTLAHYALLIVLVETSAASAATASTAGAVLGALLNYVLNRRYTFKSDARHAQALPRFLLVAAAGMVLNWSLMAMLTGLLHLHYLGSQLLATVAVLLLGYLINTRWTFGRS